MIDIETNYFTIIEEHFRVARGTGMFIFSPRDVALIETWKESGVPIEAVLRGIDVVFEKRRARSGLSRTQPVNSIAYCTESIAEEAQAMANTSAPVTNKASKPPFPIEDVQSFFARNIEALRTAGHEQVAESLESLDLDVLFADLDQLEQRLTEIEEKMIARLLASASEEQLRAVACEIDRELKPYRNKMTSDQMAMLERKFLERKLLGRRVFRGSACSISEGFQIILLYKTHDLS